MTNDTISQTGLTDFAMDLDAPRSEPYPAHVRCAPYTRRPDLAPLDTAAPGDIVAIVAGYHAQFEEGDMERHLEGVYVAGDTGPTFAFYDQLTGASRDRAARVALDRLFLGDDIRGEVVDWNMVECELYYQVAVVTFAEARVLINLDLLPRLSLPV